MTRRAGAVVAAAGLWALAGCSGELSGPPPAKSPNRMSAAELTTYSATAGPTFAVNAIVDPPAPSVRQKSFHVQTGASKVRIVAPVPAATTPEPPAMAAAPAVPGHPDAVRAARSNPEAKAQARAIAGIHLVKVGEPKPSRDGAKEDAIRKAKDALIQKLCQLDPPVTTAPSLARVQNEYCPANLVKVDVADDPKWDELKRLNGQSELYVAEVTVELTDDQVRQLRQEERVQNGLIGVGGLAVGALAVCGLLRAGTAAGRLTRGRLGRCTTARILFWTIGPPLVLFLLVRLRR
jgi:hypothetical protein